MTAPEVVVVDPNAGAFAATWTYPGGRFAFKSPPLRLGQFEESNDALRKFLAWLLDMREGRDEDPDVYPCGMDSRKMTFPEMVRMMQNLVEKGESEVRTLFLLGQVVEDIRRIIKGGDA